MKNYWVLLWFGHAVLYKKTLHYSLRSGMVTVCKETYNFIVIQLSGNVDLFTHHSYLFDDAKLPNRTKMDVTISGMFVPFLLF
ncbi:hypothetical protein [Parabacteroides bouchesdurhonensis]|uniref:hypothetical protein n=1 Tax=Parabacteroides bouchesdurhonensis TaxID=1936995 RepID=UPI00164D90E8|nr:hypothetical protein [Parabacteroides bouchesdurhonensis]